jgi:predicted metal-dependent hydrolase
MTSQSEEIPAEFWQGVTEFNQQEFYACHDTLEALWMESSEPDRTFYQGVLQIAVGLYHLSNQNWRGAVILLGEGINRLGYYQPIYSGINVEFFIRESVVLLNVLQRAGAEKVTDFLPLFKGDIIVGIPPLPKIEKPSLTPILIVKGAIAS